MRAKLKIPEHIIHQMTKAVNLKQVDLASSAIMEADPVVHSWIFESKDINAVIVIGETKTYTAMDGVPIHIYSFDVYQFRMNEKWYDYLEVNTNYVAGVDLPGQPRMLCHIYAKIKQGDLPWEGSDPVLSFKLGANTQYYL